MTRPIDDEDFISDIEYGDLTLEDGRLPKNDGEECEVCGKPAFEMRQIIRQDNRGTWRASGEFLFACDEHVAAIEEKANTPVPWR